MLKNWYVVSLALGMCALFAEPVRSQVENDGGTGAATTSQPEGTLPPIIVRPETEPADDSAPLTDPTTDPFDLPNTYPSLREQIFNGPNGILRNDKSIFDTPQLGTVIDRQQIDERQATDVARALEQEVSVLIQSTARGQASPYIRGLTGQEVLILIDGIRLNNVTFRFGPNQYLNTVDPGQIDRIEVVRGPASVAWGSDAIGGAINILTRSAAIDRGDYFTGGSIQEIFSTADTASYTRVNGEGASGNWDVFAGASYMAVNNLDRGGDLGRQPFTNYDQYAGDIKLNYIIDECQMLTFALSHFEQQNVPRSDRFAPFVNTPVTSGAVNLERPTFFDPQQRDLAYMRWQGMSDLGPINAYTVTASYQRQKEGTLEIRPELNPDQVEVSEFTDATVGLTFALMTDLYEAGKLTYGVDMYHDEIDASRVRSAGPSGLGNRNPQFPGDSYYERFGVFLNWDYPVLERLTIDSGLRFENIQTAGTLGQFQAPLSHFERTYSDWIFSVGAVYEVNEYFHLVGGMYEGFRAPNLDDLAADNTVQAGATDSPSLNVQPEHSLTYEAGFKWNYPRLRGQYMFFWNDFDDRIQRQRFPLPTSNNFVRDNFDVYIYGTEFTSEYLLTETWSVYGNYWYVFGQDLERNEPVSRIPPQQGILGLRWRDDCLRSYFDVYAWIVDRQERYANENFSDPRFPAGGNPAYATLNLRMGRTIENAYGDHRLSLNLENITDKAYRVLGSGVDGPGFNAIFGYEYSF